MAKETQKEKDTFQLRDDIYIQYINGLQPNYIKKSQSLAIQYLKAQFKKQ